MTNAGIRYIHDIFNNVHDYVFRKVLVESKLEVKTQWIW